MKKNYSLYLGDDLGSWLEHKAEKNLRSFTREVEVILLAAKEAEENQENETV